MPTAEAAARRLWRSGPPSSARNPRARLVCLDIQPNASTQAAEREDILNVGGFSDAVFEIVAAFAQGDLRPGHWVEQIEQIAL